MRQLGSLIGLLAAGLLLGPASHPAVFEKWQHSASFYLLTTPAGAAFPESTRIAQFPILIRWNAATFPFHQALPGGEDIRFSSPSGEPFAYQIEEWNPKEGQASVWVRIPEIRGNTVQEVRVHWGNRDAATESNGEQVFNVTNGYLSVWHMSEPVADATGFLKTTDVGTTAQKGIVGMARHLAGGQGISGGEKIEGFPVGSEEHTTEAWIRPERSNGRIVGWGNEHAQGKVVMNLVSPPHLRMDCYFSGADVSGTNHIPMNEWTHVVHTHRRGESRVYFNGQLDGESVTSSSPLAIRSPARLWLGGWYGNYDFKGMLDEVRISKIVRSPEWIRLQFENQKEHQTLVGPPVKAGRSFVISPFSAEIRENQTAVFRAESLGAIKSRWIEKRGGREQVVAVDQDVFTFRAGRVSGDQTVELTYQAVYLEGVQTKRIPVLIKEDVPDPDVVLEAPGVWEGRTPIQVLPRIRNLEEMARQGAGAWSVKWTVTNLAVIAEKSSGQLTLKRSQNSGLLTVTAELENGGETVTRSVSLNVTEPKTDPWVNRDPETEELPQDNQFIARDTTGRGTLWCRGKVDPQWGTVHELTLRLYADGKLSEVIRGPVAPNQTYSLSLRVPSGLVRYRVELAAGEGERPQVVHVATNVVCGDAYLIQGQSNAVATDWGKEEPEYRSEWIRTFGSMTGDPHFVGRWGMARYRGHEDETFQVGYWGMELARRLVENHQVPVCLLNGAVGGTRIDQHLRNPDHPADGNSIYGRLLRRTRLARLTHGIKAVFWYQGENDQGADGPTGGYGWETYQSLFIQLAAAWKQDFPNIQHYYVFQIWPNSCSMGIRGSDDRLREVQRNLPMAFSRMGIMSTLGVDPPGECHYPAAGYSRIAALITPLVERDLFGVRFDRSITPPNLRQARFGGVNGGSVVLEFDQRVTWNAGLASQFYLDGRPGRVESGSAAGHRITLILKGDGKDSIRHVTYLKGASWSPRNLIRGENGIAALTFCEVPILPSVTGP